MLNWIIFIAFYLALALIAFCLLYLIVKALIAIIRMEKHIKEMLDFFIQSEKYHQQEQLRQ